MDEQEKGCNSFSTTALKHRQVSCRCCSTAARTAAEANSQFGERRRHGSSAGGHLHSLNIMPWINLRRRANGLISSSGVVATVTACSSSLPGTASEHNGALASTTAFGHIGNGGTYIWADPQRDLVGVYLSVSPRLHRDV